MNKILTIEIFLGTYSSNGEEFLITDTIFYVHSNKFYE